MTFPVGKLPNSSHLQDLSAANVPTKSLAFSHGGSDVDLTDPTNGMNPCATAFFAAAAGNLVAQLAGDSSTRTFPVLASQVVQGAFILISGSSTVDGVILGRH